MRDLVLPQYRPTLNDILVRYVRRRFVRILIIIAAVALLIAGAILIWQVRRTRIMGPSYAQKVPIAFNFHYPKEMVKVEARQGEMVRFQASGQPKSMDIFTVERMKIPNYVGAVTGALPLIAEREVTQLKHDYSHVTVLEEGRTRIKAGPGYGIIFRARQGKRLVEGRRVLIPFTSKHPRSGVVLTAFVVGGEATKGSHDVSSYTLSSHALRSFQFGASS